MKRFSKLTPFPRTRDDWHPLIEANFHFKRAYCNLEDRVRALLTFKQIYELDHIDLSTTARQSTIRMRLQSYQARVDMITASVEHRRGHVVSIKFEPGPENFTTCEATIIASNESALKDIVRAMQLSYGIVTSSAFAPVLQLDDAIKIKLQKSAYRPGDRTLACNSLEETRSKLAALRVEYNQARHMILKKEYRNFSIVALIATLLIAALFRFAAIIEPHGTVQWLAFSVLALVSGCFFTGVASTFETLNKLKDRSNNDFFDFAGDLFMWAWTLIVPSVAMVKLGYLGKITVPGLAQLVTQPGQLIFEACRQPYHSMFSACVGATVISFLILGFTIMLQGSQETQRHIAGFWND